MTKKRLSLPELVEQLDEALRKYDRLAFDEEGEHELGKPCSPKQIAKLEKQLGKPLPPSYKAFLELHNGWSHFSGDAKLLAVEDQKADWVEERLSDLEELFDEFGRENPFKAQAMPVMLGEDSKQSLLIDPRTVRPDGEMDFVALYITREEKRFKDFTSFLKHKLDLLNEMIDDEMKGTSDEDDTEG
jgi:SMI1 / KNR4 family (SUKH-1)